MPGWRTQTSVVGELVGRGVQGGLCCGGPAPFGTSCPKRVVGPISNAISPSSPFGQTFGLSIELGLSLLVRLSLVI